MTINNAGVAGFILAIMALCFCWVPWLGGLLWLAGAAFSAAGMFSRRPKAFAIAGLAVSLAWLAAYLTVSLIFGTFMSFTIYPFDIW